MLVRKIYREFPFFFLYIGASIPISIIRVFVIGNYQLFFMVYWGTEVLYTLLALLTLHEVFRTVFAAFYENRWFWLFFPCAVTAISGMAIVYRFGSPPVQANRVISLIVSLGMAVNLVQAAIFILFFGLLWWNGIRWRNYPTGIVLGFAAIAVVLLGANWARSEFGTKFNTLRSYAPAVAYIVAVALWLETFLRPPEPEPKWTHEITPEQMLEQVQQYTRIVERLLGRRK
ncbi:MAG TPA: hypothetical protein VNW97_03435 [Candidatus Saccharimonadales bacterium]|nr:hypothetical protein [Candidatus Saccharimonadales bacterium]